MLRVRVYNDGRLEAGGAELLGRPGLTWVDVLNPTEAELLPLQERFGLHRLAIEDCLHLDQRPKLEEYPGHQFLVLQGFSAEKDDLSDLTMHELHFFLGPDWVLSVHEGAMGAVDAVGTRVGLDPSGTMGKGVDFLCYLLTDALTDKNFPVMDKVSDAIETLEEQVFDGRGQQVLQHAMHLKRDLALVRRVLSPQRDVVGLLARRGVVHVQEKTALYFRDVYDHLVRLYEQIDAARDLLGNAMDAHLSVVANRTAEVSKQLTVFASIFLPLSFIVGFFGQNFEPLVRPPMYWVMLSSMVLVPSSTIWWMRRKGWW